MAQSACQSNMQYTSLCSCLLPWPKYDKKCPTMWNGSAADVISIKNKQNQLLFMKGDINHREKMKW